MPRLFVTLTVLATLLCGFAVSVRATESEDQRALMQKFITAYFTKDMATVRTCLPQNHALLFTQYPFTATPTLSQPKELEWDGEAMYLACLFLDISTHKCLIYPARPLVCRLFGRVPHLPCPVGKVPADLDASHVLEAYYAQRLQTFQDWMMSFGYFSYGDLLGDEAEQDFIEL